MGELVMKSDMPALMQSTARFDAAMHGNRNPGDLESVLSIRIRAAEILRGTTSENVVQVLGEVLNGLDPIAAIPSPALRILGFHEEPRVKGLHAECSKPPTASANL